MPRLKAIFLALSCAACVTSPDDADQSYESLLPPGSGNQEAHSQEVPGYGKPAVVGFGLAAPSSTPMPLSVMPFPNTAVDRDGRNVIRVRVYPHFNGTTFKDDHSKVSLEGTCTVYAGSDKSTGRKGKKPLRTVKKLNLSIKALKAPFWLECSEPVKVVRQEGMRSHSYPGNLYIHVNKTQAQPFVEVINIVPMESYLRGVVPSEVIPSWPAETLKAQAVAARTYAYYNIASVLTPIQGAKPKHAAYYDVDDTSFFQAYSGLTTVYPDTDKAIAATEGQILTFNNKLLLSWFHADAGGHTENAEAVFGLNAPYCSARKEPVESPKRDPAWKVEIPLAEFSAAVSPPGTPPVTIKAVRIQPSQRNSSGRVTSISIDTGSGLKTVPANVIKKRFRSVHSYLFDIELRGEKILISGKGSGHGVGMSQIGAKELAKKQNWDYQKILAFYYSGSGLCHIGGNSGSAVKACF